MLCPFLHSTTLSEPKYRHTVGCSSRLLHMGGAGAVVVRLRIVQRCAPYGADVVHFCCAPTGNVHKYTHTTLKCTRGYTPSVSAPGPSASTHELSHYKDGKEVAIKEGWRPRAMRTPCCVCRAARSACSSNKALFGRNGVHRSGA